MSHSQQSSGWCRKHNTAVCAVLPNWVITRQFQLLSYDYLWDWKTHRIVDLMQVKAHAQAQGQHAQSGAGHARTKGPRKHSTKPQWTNAQTGARYAHTNLVSQKGLYGASTRLKIPDVSQAHGSVVVTVACLCCRSCCESNHLLNAQDKKGKLPQTGAGHAHACASMLQAAKRRTPALRLSTVPSSMDYSDRTISVTRSESIITCHRRFSHGVPSEEWWQFKSMGKSRLCLRSVRYNHKGWTYIESCSEALPCYNSGFTQLDGGFAYALLAFKW